MSTHLESCCTELSRVIDRLRLLPSHDALVLLRECFSAPKLMHILRCAPCDGQTSLVEFDNLLKRGISLICNSELSGLQMLQASLPVRDGRLGIRSVVPLALSALLASAAGTRDLQSSILTKTGVSSNDCVDNMSCLPRDLLCTLCRLLLTLLPLNRVAGMHQL